MTVVFPETLLARDREIARATAHLIDDRLVAGRAVVVTGSPGAGRTRFASTLAERARRVGAAPLWVAAAPSLCDVELGAFGVMLEPVPEGVTTDALAALGSQLRFHGGAATTLLVIDDAHWLDDCSAAAVLQAISTRAVAAILTVCADAQLPSDVSRLVDDEFAVAVDLAPFDRIDIAAIVSGALGGQPAQSTVELLWRWSAGNAACLAAMVELGEAEGRFTPIEGQWWWIGDPPAPNAVAQRLARRLSGLDARALDALIVLAIAEWMSVGTLEQMGFAAAVVELESAGLVCSHEEGPEVVVWCASGMVAPAAIARAMPLQRRSLAQRALEALPSPDTPRELARAARLQLHAGPSESTTADMLLRGASMLRLSEPGLASELVTASHRWSPSVESHVSLVFDRLEIGDVAGAEAALDEVRDTLRLDERDRTRLIEADFAIALFGRRDVNAARAILEAESAPAEAPVSAPIRAGTESLLAQALMLSARPDAARAAAHRALGSRHATAKMRLRANVALGSSMILSGETTAARRHATSVLDTARRMPEVMPTAAGMLNAQLAFMQLWHGELTPSLAAHPESGRWPTPPAHDEHPAFTWSLLAGIVAHVRGEHHEAIGRLREAVVQHGAGRGIFEAEAYAWLVVALCDGGRRAEAEVTLQRFPQRWLAVTPGLRAWAAGVVASAGGRRADAEQLLNEAASESAAVGASLCEARYLIELADRCDCVDAIGRLDELALALDAPLLQLLCETSVARLKGDVDGLLRAAATLADRGLTMRAAATARDVERLARADGSTHHARRAARLRRQTSSPKGVERATTTPAGLTRRENEVASLAAGGLTDRQIAARLVVSVRTVESHLASSYRKLGVSSRFELDNALA